MAMRAQEAATIEIPNITWEVFEKMMTYIYTGERTAGRIQPPTLLLNATQLITTAVLHITHIHQHKHAACTHILCQNVSVCVVRIGSVEVPPERASELLQASDQYLLDGLKKECEGCLAKLLAVENLEATFELSEAFSAPQVRTYWSHTRTHALKHPDEQFLP